MTIKEAYTITRVGKAKDYSLLEKGAGYIYDEGYGSASAINPQMPVKFIALLRFAPGETRGNHYHKSKTETILITDGEVRCGLALVDDPKEYEELILEAGDMITIKPGCAHFVEALKGVVTAVEWADQSFTESDVYSFSFNRLA